MRGLQVDRTAPAPCPQCGRTGFFGPRRDEAKVHQYRLCKFCGFAQDVDQAPVTYRPSVHGCPQWRQVAGAPYVWWVPATQSTYHCPYCGAPVDVQAHAVTPPVSDPSHPWWKVPQGLSHAESYAYWESQGYLVGYV